MLLLDALQANFSQKLELMPTLVGIPFPVIFRRCKSENFREQLSAPDAEAPRVCFRRNYALRRKGPWLGTSRLDWAGMQTYPSATEVVRIAVVVVGEFGVESSIPMGGVITEGVQAGD